MNVLITGGAGYVGTELCGQLSALDEVDQVLIFDNLSRNNYNLFLGAKMQNHPKVRFIHGDILDSRNLKKSLKGVDTVYHLAAKVTTPFAIDDAHHHEQINHWGTSEVIAAVEESEVKKFIYLSSTSIYGSSNDYLTEESLPKPKTFYGTTKYRGEEHVKRLLDRMEASVLRSANVYGYNRSMRFDAVINRFMFDANFKKQISVHGNGKQSRAFIHVSLLAKVLRDMLLVKVPNGVYNVVDRNLRILDIVDALKEIYPELEFIFINQHLQLRQMMVDPASQLRKYIDYSNQTDLKEELLHFKDRFSF
jgi:UDP-glucose 4-epimerase